MFYLVLIERLTDFLVNMATALLFAGIISVFIDLNLGHFVAYFAAFVIVSAACLIAGDVAKDTEAYYRRKGKLR